MRVKLAFVTMAVTSLFFVCSSAQPTGMPEKNQEGSRANKPTNRNETGKQNGDCHALEQQARDLEQKSGALLRESEQRKTESDALLKRAHQADEEYFALRRQATHSPGHGTADPVLKQKDAERLDLRRQGHEKELERVALHKQSDQLEQQRRSILKEHDQRCDTRRAPGNEHR